MIRWILSTSCLICSVPLSSTHTQIITIKLVLGLFLLLSSRLNIIQNIFPLFSSRESRLKQPDILFGRTGQELPCLRLCPFQGDIIATHTGPDGGLTTVNRGQRGHVTSQDPDVSYIDSEEDATAPAAALNSTSNDGKCFIFVCEYVINILGSLCGKKLCRIVN